MPQKLKEEKEKTPLSECVDSRALLLSCSGVVKMRKLTYDNPTTDFTRGKKNNRAENERNEGKVLSNESLNGVDDERRKPEGACKQNQ